MKEPRLRIPRGVWTIVREVGRHLLRRPVVGIAAAARTPDGRWLLVRRGDTGQWALPGGTLEWGERLRDAITREVEEETGSRVRSLGDLVGVYSDPKRDLRFHAVTVVVQVEVDPPSRAPDNPVEIPEVALFDQDSLPAELSHGMTQMLEDARRGQQRWE